MFVMSIQCIYEYLLPFLASSQIQMNSLVDFTFYHLSTKCITATGRTSIVYRVTAGKDAVIYLTENDSGTNQGTSYHICWGCWANSRSVIVDGSTTVSNYYAAVLSTDFFNAFWISWANGLIRAGTGASVGNNVVMTYTDPTPFTPTYILFRTNWGGSPGDWRFHVTGN
jgi:hypothetical protein